ncbi:MAG: hypothetical protein WKG32_09750 [Gemmatimonadaceae bacterium]
MTDPPPLPLGLAWQPARPRVLVVACSDGRLQEATDHFLARHLGVTDYDRLYVPGGGGALSASGRDFMRAHQLQGECRFLVESHAIESLVLLFHGPAPDGPDEAMCVDYRRKLSWASVARLREQQERDALELLDSRWQWAGTARVLVFRCEVGAGGGLAFVSLHADAAADARRPRDARERNDTLDAHAPRQERRPLAPGRNARE